MSDNRQQATTSKDAGSTSGSETVVISKEKEQQEQPVLKLRLHKPDSDHKVKWTSDTVDNEFMGKKKSKCCCIYEKPKVFGESSSSSSEGEEDGHNCTPNCRGHKKKCFRQKHGKQHQHQPECEHSDHQQQGPSTHGASGT